MIHSSKGTSYHGKMHSDVDGDIHHEKTPSPRRRDMMAGSKPRPIVPKSLSEAYRIAQAVCAAKMAPKGLDTPEACMIAIMHGLELGLSPLSALQRIAVINGRPTLWGDGALALVKASSLCEAIDEWIEGEKPEMWVAVCNVMRRGDLIPTERRFSVEDAKRAKLWGKAGPWSDYPKRMLQMRARAFALRDAFPDVLGGLYLTEELIQDHNETNEAYQRASQYSEKANIHATDSVDASNLGKDRELAIESQQPHHHGTDTSINPSDENTTSAGDNTHNAHNAHNAQPTCGEEPKPRGIQHTNLPPIANLRRSRRMPRNVLALRFRKQWSIRQPKAPPPSHEPVEDRFIPEEEPEICLDLFDAALCCANDHEILMEIAEEFSERIKTLPQHAKNKSDAIFERHAFRVENGAHKSPDQQNNDKHGFNEISVSKAIAQKQVMP